MFSEIPKRQHPGFFFKKKKKKKNPSKMSPITVVCAFLILGNQHSCPKMTCKTGDASECRPSTVIHYDKPQNCEIPVCVKGNDVFTAHLQPSEGTTLLKKMLKNQPGLIQDVKAKIQNKEAIPKVTCPDCNCPNVTLYAGVLTELDIGLIIWTAIQTSGNIFQIINWVLKRYGRQLRVVFERKKKVEAAPAATAPTAPAEA